MEQNRIERLSEFISNPYVNLGLRMFIGVVFLLSAISKMPHHMEFEAVVKDYEILPDVLATAYANAMPWLELLVGVYLIAGVIVKPATVLTLLMGISFMIANVKSLTHGEAFCGDCFGDVWSLPVEQAISIDILVMIAALILLISRPNPRSFSINRLLNQKQAEDSEEPWNS